MADNITGYDLPAEQETNLVPTPDEAIESYDGRSSTDVFKSLLGPSQEQIQQKENIDRYYKSVAAGKMAQNTIGRFIDPIQEDASGSVSMVDPDAVIGGFTSDAGRAIRAGWGDLVYTTGDAIDYVSAVISPNDPEPNTAVGDWLKKKGTEIQNENLLIISEDLQDVTWQDMFKAEMWTSKVARLIPYAASFMIPYGVGATIGGRFGSWAMKGLAKSGKVGKMSRVVSTTSGGEKVSKLLYGTNRVGGSGLAQHLAIDAGKAGVIATKGVRNVSQAIGGGLAANTFEGMYLGGETYSQGIKEGLTKEQAASAASGVVWDNAKWAAVDIVQYGILFGGVGKTMNINRVARLTPQPMAFSASVGGVIKPLVQRGLINLPTVGVYAGVEGFSEGVQETYQEWIKYANLNDVQGKGYDSYTDYIKDADGNFTKEARDIFCTSVG